MRTTRSFKQDRKLERAADRCYIGTMHLRLCVGMFLLAAATACAPNSMTDSNQPPMNEAASVYGRIGAAPFATLAERHYAGIDTDPRLRAMFPDDLSASSQSVRDMREFLTQFFGGPQEYSERKGHPRLRGRHMGFTIDQAARDAWLEHALKALDESAAQHGIPASCQEEIREYLIRTSQFMINTER